MPDDLPYGRRRDLTSSEIDTIKYYIDSGKEINSFLRGTAYFEASLHVDLLRKAHIIDGIIKKSKLSKEYALFRGIYGAYAERVLDDVLNGINIFKEFGYSSFTFNNSIAMNIALQCEDYGIIYFYDSKIGESALFIGGRECEIVFPRKISWYIKEKRIIRYSNCTITVIYLDKEEIL